MITDAGADAGGSQFCAPPTDLGEVANIPWMPYYGGAASADMNGDGLLDLVALHFDRWSAPGSSECTVDIFLGLPDGGLSAPTQYPGTDGVFFVVADLNGDGRADVAASAWGTINVSLNLGDGRLGAPIPYSDPPLARAFLDYVVLSAGDVTGDGRPDLVVSHQNDAFLLAGNGDGTFGSPQALLTDSPETFGPSVIADLNGDGLRDIALTSSSYVANSCSSAAVTVLLMRADGGFEATRYASPPSFCAFQIATVNEQGQLPDLVFSLYDRFTTPDIEGVGVLKNDGDGSFADGGFFDTLNRAGSILSADLNGDCIPDLVTTGSSGFDVPGTSVIYGLPGGGFAAPVLLQAVGGGADGIAFLGPVGTGPKALGILDHGVGEWVDGGWWSDGGIFILGHASQQ